MPFSREQKKSFRRFLRKIDQELYEKLDVDSVIEFFSIMIDFNLGDLEFEKKVAYAFRHQPHKLKDPVVLDALSGMGAIRRAMVDNNVNSKRRVLLPLTILLIALAYYEKKRKI